MKLIVQPDAGVAPIVTSIKAGEEEHRHPHLSPRSVRDCPRARGRRRPRRARARVDGAYQSGRHQEPEETGTVAARGRCHRVAHRRRPCPLSRQDDDRRRQDPACLRLQLHGPRHRQEPELWHHQQEQEADQRSEQALYRGLRPSVVLGRLRTLRRQPRECARPPREVHRRRTQAALDLRPSSDRRRDAPPAGRAGESGGRRQDHRASRGEVDGKHQERALPGKAAPYPRDRSRRKARVHGQSEPPAPRTRKAARSRRHRDGPIGRAADAGRVREGLGADAKRQEEEAKRGEGRAEGRKTGKGVCSGLSRRSQSAVSVGGPQSVAQGRA